MLPMLGGICGSIRTRLNTVATHQHLSRMQKAAVEIIPRRLLANRSLVTPFPIIPALVDRLRLFLPTRWRVDNPRSQHAFAARADHRLRPGNNPALVARPAHLRSPDQVANRYSRR